MPVVRNDSRPYHEVMDANFNIISSMDRCRESIEDPIKSVEHKFSWSGCAINQYELEQYELSLNKFCMGCDCGRIIDWN